MARFRYSLQSILDIKLKMETQAKQEFSIAKVQLDEEEKKRDILLQRKENYEEEARERLTGTLNVREMEEARNAILTMEDFIVVQEEQVTRAQTNLEKAREKMTELMKERKTHESLKEKAFEEFRMEENKQESKSIDELTSYTYGQKRQVKN